jgi:hypothetical protein
VVNDENPHEIHSSVPRTRKLVGVDALKAHLTLVFGLALCVAAFWFELDRAERGNALSWAYVFEWPLLAVFAVYMWWNVLDPTRQDRVRAKKKPKQLGTEFDGMLLAWQEHQRELVEQNERDETAASDGPAPGTS